MNLQLTQKERTFLEDQKKHEEICIQKYTNYARQAGDPQLKQLFNQYASQEQQHYNTINQLLQGQQPVPGSSNQGFQQQGQQSRDQQLQSRPRAGMADQGDAALCTDMLMTEKFVSSTYDTAILNLQMPRFARLCSISRRKNSSTVKGSLTTCSNMGCIILSEAKNPAGSGFFFLWACLLVVEIYILPESPAAD